MVYPALGIVVTIGVLIGSAIYYYVNSRNNNNNYNYEPYYPSTGTRPSIEARKRRSRRNQSNIECVVCLNTIGCNEAKQTLDCGHTYHSYCITEWFKVSKTCPLCRESKM